MRVRVFRDRIDLFRLVTNNVATDTLTVGTES